SGMAAQQLVLDNTANNLANLNTTGFKRSMIEFQDLIYSTLRAPGAVSTQGLQVPTGIQIGNGVKVAGTTRLFATGPFTLTRNLSAATPASGAAQTATPGQNGTGQIQGGTLEQSNVDVVQEMVNLIQAERAYEFNTKAVQTADQMLAASTNIIR